MSASSCLSAGSELSAGYLREQKLIALLSTFLGAGVFFMLVPGTIVGVWNLIQIGNLKDAAGAELLWIQTHGHAQLFGWIGTFILGIGYYYVPNLRRVSSSGFYEGWACCLLWISGVALRSFAGFTDIAWEWLFPISAIFEFTAVAFFIYITMKGSKLSRGSGLKAWSILLISGSFSWLLLMLANIPLLLQMSINDAGPVVSDLAGKRFLFAAVWGWVTPIVWGLAAAWLPSFLGLAASNEKLFKLSAMLNILAVLFYALAVPLLAESMVLISSLSYVSALGLFKRSQGTMPEQVRRAPSFPFFVRSAFSWLLLSASLFVLAALFPDCHGVHGAARHAITVGFFSTMVFSIGPRVLPAFLGRKQVFSEKLAALSLILLFCGCSLRVVSQILAYDFGIKLFWNLLPLSAFFELSAVAIFAFNMLATLWLKSRTQLD